VGFRDLKARGFRAYDSLEVEFGPGVNVLYGPNASGKTSLLEALSVLATGRSFRRAADSEMVRNGHHGYRLAASVMGRLGPRSLEASYALGQGETGGTKRLTVDGHPLARSIDLLGVVPVLAFSPDDLALVKGPPAERRRFLDFLLAQTSPSYRDALTAYNRALAQRNALLTEIAARRLTPDSAGGVLESWDETLASRGETLAAWREQAVAEISPAAARAFGDIDGGSLSIRYEPSPFDPSLRMHEVRRGTTLSGPHRDELGLAVDGRDARRFASQGQQRSAVLALKLAAAELLAQATDEQPVLLLDDVLSELDPRRAAALVPLLFRGQAFVTTTDRAALERALDTAGAGLLVESWLEVIGGRVTPTTSAGPEPPRGGAAP